MAITGSIPPYGFDRADGTGYGGTADPANAVITQGDPSDVTPDVFFEELPDSPTFEIAEHVTVTHKFKCDFGTAQDMMQQHPRGRIVTDSLGLNYQILSCAYQNEKGSHCLLTMTMEGAGATNNDPTGGFDPPPAECTIEPVEFNPPIWYHPRYKTVRRYNLNDNGGIVNSNLPTGYDLIRFIQSAAMSAQHEYMRDNILLLSLDNVTDLDVRSLCAEIVCKLRKGESEFYLSGWRVQFSYYTWLPTFLCPGGFIQDPVFSGELPWWVWSTLGDPAADPEFDNIFIQAASVNPDLYEHGISWLRFADHRDFSRVWWKTTQTWVGGPLGAWDKDIYPVYVGAYDTGESDLSSVTAVLS